ncbi:MAG TPA: DUF1631 domain-containing protein [Thiobacillaceae bacterium]|nr:DUF1631 domain-containing protein [Thiobacillaceae bacterium]
MQDSRKNNVVELSQFGPGRGAGSPDRSALLNQCGEQAASAMAAALNKTLEQTAEELLEITDRVTAYDTRRIYDEAMDFARDRRGEVETEFRRRFFQRFKRECRRDAGRATATFDLDSTQLALVEPEDLEESLAASTVENAINNVCGEELFGLAKRVGMLLDDPEMQLGANPVGPEAIGAVVMEALKALNLAVKAQLVLVPLINKRLPMRVREVYQGLNRLLVERGVLPTIRVGVRKPAPTPPRPPAATPDGMPSATPQGLEAGEGPDLLSLFQQFLNMGSLGLGGMPAPLGAPPGALPGGLVPAPPGGLEPGSYSVSPALLQSLTRLQRGEVEGLVGDAFDASRFGDGHVNILREIRGTPMASGMGQMDAMTLDIVSMVFDYILDDRRIPDAMKALIGRLQIPVLKVAMLDRNFFSQKSHPARRLLDALAEASMGWNEDEGHESGLYQKVEDLVQRVLGQFDEQMDIFAVVLEELQQYATDEKQRIDSLTSRSAQVIRQREQAELGRVVAHTEVESHLFDRSMPEFIRAFLLSHWEQVLALYCARSGEGGEEWRQALLTMDELIWSVSPKVLQEDRRKLVSLLPNLLKRLERGLEDLGITREMRDQFFTGLVKCHAVAVRAGLRGGSEAPPAPEPAPLPPPAPAAEIVEGGGGFVEITSLTEAEAVDPALIEEIAAEPEERPLVEEIVIGDVGWLAGGGETIEKDAYEISVQQLKRGAWIEYRLENGERARAKLAWVSPLKGIYLFTNRLGQRAMSINAEGLAAMLRDGEAEILDSVPLMERAVSSLLERLQMKVA